MAQILIERTPGAPHEEVDESLLVKTEGRDETDNEIVTWVEYRFPGDAHIVNRGVHVQLKRWPAGLGAVVADLQ